MSGYWPTVDVTPPGYWDTDDTIRLDVCTDCLIAAINGDYPEDITRGEAVAAGIAELAKEGYPILTTESDDDPFFSHNPCDCCRTHLGGTRVTMLATRKD